MKKMRKYEAVLVNLVTGGNEEHKWCYGNEIDAGLEIIEEATGIRQAWYSRGQYIGWRNRTIN